MGKRYYCDYCERYFIDDLQARKKHLTSTLHIRNRNVYYKQFQDIDSFINEELKKPICKKFKTSGTCAFGENCCNTHYSAEQLSRLKQKVEEEKQLKINLAVSKLPTIEDWIQYCKSRKNCNINLNHNLLQRISDFNPMVMIPPSLLIPDASSTQNLTFTEWG